MQKYNFTFTVVEVPVNEHKYEVQTIDDVETTTRKTKKKKSKKNKNNNKDKNNKLNKAAKTVSNLNAFVIRKEKD